MRPAAPPVVPAPAPAPTTPAPKPSATSAAGPGEITVELVNDTDMQVEWLFSTGDGASTPVGTTPPRSRRTVVYRPHPETAVGIGVRKADEPTCGGAGDAYTMQSPGHYSVTVAYAGEPLPREGCSDPQQRDFFVSGGPY